MRLILILNFSFCTDFGKLIQQRQLLDGQLNENKSVLEELNLLSADNQVWCRTFRFYSMYFRKSIFYFDRVGVQIVWTRIGETRSRRKPTKCRETNGLHKKGIETLQRFAGRFGKETRQTAREYSEIATKITTTISNDYECSRNKSIDSIFDVRAFINWSVIFLHYIIILWTLNGINTRTPFVIMQMRVCDLNPWRHAFRPSESITKQYFDFNIDMEISRQWHLHRRQFFLEEKIYSIDKNQNIDAECW